jgi:crotonobetainyl-CoA:carnitine CoA-transferase CaiB-like acyl-CoA transferase
METTLDLEGTRPGLMGDQSLLTDRIQSSIDNPSRSSDFDLHAAVDEVLKDVGMAAADSGGKVSFYGSDPIIPSRLRFGAAAAASSAAKAVAIAALWRDRTGEGQDIKVDVRKALRRFAGFFEEWETMNGRRPAAFTDPTNPFIDTQLFRRTKEGRHVVTLNIYPQAAARALAFLKAGVSHAALNDAIGKWNADELEAAGAKEGLILAKVRTFAEFRKEQQYTDVLSKMPLITVEKIGESAPVPFGANANSPLDGIRALGMGHVIAGAGIGRDLAAYGADVLNTWRPGETEFELFALDVQVGMRQALLDKSPEDRAKFEELLQGADIFFANKRPGYLERYGLTAAELSAKRPGLIHAQVLLHGDVGPWKDRPGFDEVGAAVSGVFAIEGSLEHPSSPPILPIVDNMVGWLGTVGVIAALRRRAIEGGSYKVTVSLTRTVLWLMSLGIFDREYAKVTAGSSDEHAYVAPDLFSAETPLGTYRGMTDQGILSKTPDSFRTVLVPQGSSKPEWLIR